MRILKCDGRSDQWRRAIALVAITVLTGCGRSGSPVAPSPPPTTASAFQQHASAHFTFQYAALDAATVAATAARVEAEYSRVVSDLGSPTTARVTVFLHPTRTSLEGSMQGIGQAVSGAMGFISGATIIHVMSPSLATAWSYEDGIRAIVHEFAHCVSLFLNPTFGNNPRWLWESVAVYETDDFVDPRHLPMMTSGQAPSLARLNGFDNGDIYQVGYTIAEFIVARWGRAGLLDLIRNNGNVTALTGLTPAAFHAEWYAFVRARYLSP